MPTKPICTVFALLALSTAKSTAGATASGIALQPLGQLSRGIRIPGVCRRNISEIGAYDPLLRRLFVTNFADNSLDIFDIRHPEDDLPPPTSESRSRTITGDSNLTPTSVAVRFPLVAVAAESISPVTARASC